MLKLLVLATLLLGDTDCSGTETIRDAQMIAQYDAGLWDGHQENCPDVGQWIAVKGRPYLMQWGDWDRNGKVDIVDALTTGQRAEGLLPPLRHVRAAWLNR